MTVPLDVPGSGEAAPEAVTIGAERVSGRSLGRIAWTRLKQDKVAMAGLYLIIFLVLVAIFAPLIVKLLGSPPSEFHQDLIDPNLQTPSGRWNGISKDLISRIVYGSRISLLVAFLATMLSVLIGTTLGVIAGYFGGLTDAIISRLMDLFLAFPLLLFSIALVGVLPTRAFGLVGNGLRIGVLVFIIGFFSWPYIGRIIRGQTLSLREREFVDASRSLGARTPHILFRELLPNLVAPILVYFTLLMATNIGFEAGLSFLGVGVIPPTPSWGGMISEATAYYQIQPGYMLVPGLAIFITVLAFNLFGDGLRDALDPRTR